MPVPLKTPAGHDFSIPSQKLADAIALEWQAQEKKVNIALMPLTRIALTAIDWVAEQRDSIIEEMLQYGETDLVCYRAEDERLRAQQEKELGPILQWLEAKYRVTFVITEGLMPVEQPDETLDKIGDMLSRHDDMVLAAAGRIVQHSTSLVLTVALLENHITVEQLIHLCQLEEQFQLAQWGEDEELRNRLGRAAKEINEAALFLRLLKAL